MKNFLVKTFVLLYMSYNVLGFTRLVNIFTDDVKMQSPTTSKDTQLIYNYVCQE